MSRYPEMPDFTIFREGWRAYEVNGETLYLPRGLGYVYARGTWRTTVNARVRYFKTLLGAWKDLCDRKNGNPLQWVPRHSNADKDLDTGVVGLSLSVYRQSNTFRAEISVSQIQNGRSRKVLIGSRVVHKLTQEWVNRKLCEGTAVRWHYARLREYGKSLHAIRVSDVPPGMIPRAPIQPIPIRDIERVVAMKQQTFKNTI